MSFDAGGDEPRAALAHERLAAVALRPATAADHEFLARLYASTREEELAAVDWTAEQKQSFLSRLLDSLAAAQEAMGPVALAGFAVATAPDIGMQRADPDDLRSLIRAAIHEVGKNGNAAQGFQWFGSKRR